MVVLFIIGMCIHFNTIGGVCFGQAGWVDRTVTQARRVFALRLPPRPSGYQEQIIVSDSGLTSRGDVNIMGSSLRDDDFEGA